MTHEEMLQYALYTPWNFYYTDPKPGVKTNAEAGCSDLTHLNFNSFVTEQATDYYTRRTVWDDAGADIHQVHMPSGWIGIDQYNFDVVDHMLEQVCKEYPHRYILPRMRLDSPKDWLKANPEEVCVYYGGPTTAEEISALIETVHYDPRGWDCQEEALISRQSFSSRLWVKDACEALRRFIEHCESTPWAKQIIGYMPMFGNCGENMWWGDWISQGDLHKGDFGISHKKLFYEWCIEKYGSLDNLRTAWGMPDLTFDTFRVPTPQERWSFHSETAFPTFWKDCQGYLPPLKTLKEVLLANDQRQVDCNEFHSKVCFDALEAMGKVVKETCGKLSGAFYGYFQDPTVGYAGHTAIDRALNTPWLDFYSSPKAYHYCLAGDPGASQAPGQSFARKKLWIEENDMRSWHAGDTYAPKNESDTITCFWRELYRALTYKQGFWWMGIGGLRDDYLGDPVLADMFRQMGPFYKKWAPVPRKGVAEVLFVEDEDSCNHMTYLMGQQIGLRYKLERELKQCGTPVDHFRVNDLLEMDLSQYKFIVFCHAFVLPQDKWNAICARIRPDAHVLWNYAAAALDPAWNPANQKSVTGFNTVETPNRLQHNDVYKHVYWHSTRLIPQDYPLLSILPEAGQEILQTSPDGHILTARIRRNGGANIYAADITLRTPLLRRLLEDAGVTCYAPAHCSVLADEKLIGFFPQFDQCFTHVFDGQWRNVMTGETVSGAIKLCIREKKFAIFEKIS